MFVFPSVFFASVKCHIQPNGGGVFNPIIMRKTIKITSVIIIILIGYMVATDAAGRWFGLWTLNTLLPVGYVAVLPFLVFLASDKNKPNNK